ncbi:preprotein translocase subunit SecA [Aquirhabdus parva]|uniref:Preprotein translocase subunit SecA n=1 Tax=Aquirhabdus parva TaxID=2283318 RepID=A0A345P4G6_9GAMM|nr:preprotein translocase subunit SecA [Aquirhabdus parva]AXI02175.1 preprotein translocase subunit SecA [Aquirhabdus parva]
MTSKAPNIGDMESHRPPSPPYKHTRLNLIYDMAMVAGIIINLCLLGVEYVLGANFTWVNDVMHFLHVSPASEEGLKNSIHDINAFFTIFLIIELLIRWGIAIIQRRYYRWFFFPFIHWYEVLGCFAILRPLRLLRAFVIAYRLYLLGYPVLPRSWIRKGQFYYELVLEELSDRIVLQVIDGVSTEFTENQTHYVLIEKIIAKHRPMISRALIEALEASLPNAIKLHQTNISQYVAAAVERSIQNTPELQQILKLMPVVGTLLSQRIEAIGARLGENIALELIYPLTEQPNPLYAEVAHQIGTLDFPAPEIEALIDSIVIETLKVVREQVSIQQWKAKL